MAVVKSVVSLGRNNDSQGVQKAYARYEIFVDPVFDNRGRLVSGKREYIDSVFTKKGKRFLEETRRAEQKHKEALKPFLSGITNVVTESIRTL